MHPAMGCPPPFLHVLGDDDNPIQSVQDFIRTPQLTHIEHT